MAKLRQDQNDNHYYTKRSRPDLGFYTQQIESEGAALLRGHGIGVGDEIPNPLLRRLEHLGYLTTGGSGVSPYTASRWESMALVADNSPNYRSMDPLVTLCCLREDQSCQLTLTFPAFDPNYFRSFSRSDRDLLQEKSGFRVMPGGQVPAVRLWPGQPPFHLNVPPMNKYLIQAEHWPLGHPTPFTAANMVLGCEPAGTFFAGPDGGSIRLLPRQPLSRARQYFALLPLTAGTPPFCLEPKDLGLPISGVMESSVISSSWRVWSITIPEDLEEHHPAALWLAALQHPLSKSRWQIKLVWPPSIAPRYSSSPQIADGEAIIVIATPPTIAHTYEMIGYSDKDFEFYVQDDTGVKEVIPLPYSSQGSAIPLRVKLPQVGNYVIRDYDGWITPLRVTVTAQSPPVGDTLLGPLPLRLILTTAGPNGCLQGRFGETENIDAKPVR